MKSQGRCDTTQTERFELPSCQCETYKGNLGPCATWEPSGDPERCAYCFHKLECHHEVLAT